ncbi:MAG TPA: DUF4097 family beta strand repeat-containing protein [Candidatus Angelobacter sp.]|nr:DUF4097 family beta strand repeat-containing protein [Candidatus Angelobacter sp.]
MSSLSSVPSRSFGLSFFLLLASVLSAHSQPSPSTSYFFHRALDLSIAEPFSLDVALSSGDITFSYGRENQLLIEASAKDAAGNRVPEEFFRNGLLIEQVANRIVVRGRPDLSTISSLMKVQYQFYVPFQTDLISRVDAGNQDLVGIAGPAKLISGLGDIQATSVTRALLEARTGQGKISCSRVARVIAETGAGNITLMEDGPSKATVKKGRGKIEVGGARGFFEGSTDGGDIHIKAVLHGEWRLNSVSGNIRIEVPPKAAFNFDAKTSSGQVLIDRDDMQKPSDEERDSVQQVNGGGKLLQARSVSGRISIQ